MKSLKLEYQYFEGCPNHEKMLHNLHLALKGLENKVEITYELVNNDEIAKKLNFRGSPTLLIEGEDSENMPVPSNAHLACRVYPGGLPSAEKLRLLIEKKLDNLENEVKNT